MNTSGPGFRSATSNTPAGIDRLTILWKVAQVAERLNCSVSTVYGLIESGQLEHHRCPGIRVSDEQLAAYLQRTKQGRPPRPKKPKAARPRLKHISLP